MEFSALPEELILKIFSYLPQDSLLAALHVSHAWKRVASDPFLWTQVTIDAELGSSTEDVLEILGGATLLRKLDISGSSVNLDEVASVAPRFRRLNEMAIHSRTLSHPAVPKILQSCEFLTSLVLRGRCAISEDNIAVLENLPCLKSLDMTEEVKMCDKIIRRICASCPLLEVLKINTKPVRVTGAWSPFLHLKSLSVTTAPTNVLLSCSRYCPNLESLIIYDVINSYRICMAQALKCFPKLRSVKVSGYPGTGWFHSGFPYAMPLECIDAPGLVIKKDQLDFLKITSRESLRKLTFNASPERCFQLRALCSFTNLESITISGLSGKYIVLSDLCTFPSLVRATLVVESHITRAVEQLASIVDVLDTSTRGGTHLALNLICVSEPLQDKVMQAVDNFRDFLSQSTRLSAALLCHLKEQCSRPRSDRTSSVITSFPGASQTLKYLVLDLM